MNIRCSVANLLGRFLVPNNILGIYSFHFTTVSLHNLSTKKKTPPKKKWSMQKNTLSSPHCLISCFLPKLNYFFLIYKCVQN